MITQIIKFNVKPEHCSAFTSALLEDKQGTEQEPGFIEMRLFADKKDPTVIFAYERLEDKEALDHHMTQPYTQKVMNLAATALQSPPEIMTLGETSPAPLLPHQISKLNPDDDPFIIFFIFKIKEGYRDQVIKRFETHVTKTREEEEGNLIFDFYTISDQNDTFAVYEHWRNESAVWDIHFNQPYSVETGKLMNESIVGNLEQYMNFVKELL